MAGKIGVEEVKASSVMSCFALLGKECIVLLEAKHSMQ
jgi:hypothetical protein